MAFKTVVFKTVLFIPSHFKPKIKIIASMIQLFVKTCFQTTILAEGSLLEVPIINKQKKRQRRKKKRLLPSRPSTQLTANE